MSENWLKMQCSTVGGAVTTWQNMWQAIRRVAESRLSFVQEEEVEEWKEVGVKSKHLQ